MAVAYVSQQEAENTGTGATLTITKPTSLASGDLMIALLWGRRSADTWATLSGWTKLGNATSTDGTDSNLTVLAKVADAGDAAASDFTFTPAAGHEEKKGVLMRITGDFSGGVGSLITSDFDNDVTPSGGTATASGGVTPVADNSLLILAIIQNSTAALSGYAIANNNPSWTERANGAVGSAVQLEYAVATSTYLETTTTGNYSVVTDHAGVAGLCLVSISETASVTVSPAVINLNLSVQAPVVAGDANVTVPAPISLTASVQTPTVTTAESKWKNTDKSSAGTITNTPKS